MKKMKPIYAGLIAAVLLVSVSTGASAQYTLDEFYDSEHWAPYGDAFSYFWGCTIFQQCEGSKWR